MSTNFIKHKNVIIHDNSLNVKEIWYVAKQKEINDNTSIKEYNTVSNKSKLYHNACVYGCEYNEFNKNN